MNDDNRADKDAAKSRLMSRIVSVISDHFDVPEERLVPSARFVDDLGMDSLDLFELIVFADDAAGGRLPTEKLDKSLTVGELIELMLSATPSPNR